MVKERDFQGHLAEGMRGAREAWVVGSNRHLHVVKQPLRDFRLPVQMLRRHLSTTEVVPVYTEDLRPGEKLVITHIPRPEKRRR